MWQDQTKLSRRKCISSSRSPRNPPETVAGGAQQVGRRVWRERHLLGPGLTADSRHCGSAGLLQRGSAAPELWGFATGKGGLDWCLVPISDDFAGGHVGVCKNPAPIRLIFHDPPWAIFSFHSKKTIRGKSHDNVGCVNDLCPDSWNPKFLIFHHSAPI